MQSSNWRLLVGFVVMCSCLVFEGLDQAQEAYRVGRLMFLELVDAQRTYTDVRLRTLELRRDLAKVEADWMSLLGRGAYANPGEER